MIATIKITYEELIKMILSSGILCCIIIQVMCIMKLAKLEDNKRLFNEFKSIKTIQEKTKKRIDKMNRKCMK